MSEKTIDTRVITVIADHLAVNVEKVIPEAHYEADLKADSLDVVELVMGLEEEFDIEINDADIEKMQTVGDTIEYIKKRLS